MARMMSVCGVLCSECPAYLAVSKGAAYQRRTADAWRRIYGLSETAGNISCGGCLGPDDQLFHTSRSCKARRCCRDKGLTSCAACPNVSCEDLERAQSVWDGVPNPASALSGARAGARRRDHGIRAGHRTRRTTTASRSGEDLDRRRPRCRRGPRHADHGPVDAVLEAAHVGGRVGPDRCRERRAVARRERTPAAAAAPDDRWRRAGSDERRAGPALLVGTRFQEFFAQDLPGTDRWQLPDGQR